jgi:NADPH2:quinone reductase
MKAAVYYETGPPEVFRIEEVRDPACPAGGVVVDVAAVSIEGGDVGHRLQGEMAARPHIVGYQCAGVIREVGAGVRDREAGQRVVAIMLHGSHAERVAVPAAATWIVPDALDLRRAACVPIPFGTADDCLFEFGQLQAGEAVLVHAGAGGVGLAAIQLAKRAGATVLATASSSAKLEKLAAFGLEHGINTRSVDFAAAARRPLASSTASTPAASTSPPPPASSPGGAAWTSSSTPSAATRWKRASRRSPTAAALRSSVRPRATTTVRTGRRSGRETRR